MPFSFFSLKKTKKYPSNSAADIFLECGYT